MTVITKSTLTCPECGFAEEVDMPTDACQYFYQCRNCKAVPKTPATFRPTAHPQALGGIVKLGMVANSFYDKRIIWQRKRKLRVQMDFSSSVPPEFLVFTLCRKPDMDPVQTPWKVKTVA